MIKLEGVSKYYKTKTGVSEGMRNVNLEFKINEFIAITGESGSGKTTLLNVISGLDSYENGELYINDLETSHYSVKDWEEFRAKNVGFVFQNYNVIDSYTVYQNVVIALEAQGYNESDKKERALELIDKVGLTSHKNQKTAKLSGGQKQRVVIARALAKNAPIILADEPTGNLDEQSGREIMKLLKDISKDKLIILVTHNYNEAKEFVTRNVIMSDGNIKDDKLVNENLYELEERVITNEESEKNSLVTSIKIANRNIFSTPKRTVFSVLLSMVAIAIFVLFYAMLIKNQSIMMGGNDKVAYVQNRDEAAFTSSDYNDLKNKYETSNLTIMPSFTEIANMVMESYENEDGFKWEEYERFYINAVKNFSDKYYTGDLPANENEILVTRYYGMEIGETIELRFKDNTYKKTFKIVGYLTYEFEETTDYYGNIAFYESFLYDENLKLNKNVFKDEAIYEMKIVGIDRQEVKIFSSKIDSNKFRFIDPFLVYEKQFEFISKTMMVFLWAVLIGILSIVFLVLYNVFKNVMQSRKKDFAVYRSIGVSEKEVALTILAEQLIIALIAIVLTIIILEVLSVYVNFFRNITRHIGIFDYVIVGLVFALFSLTLGLRYNKKIFNITVIDSLKEDN